jgi:ComF family protein
MYGHPLGRICMQLLGDQQVSQWYAARDQGLYLPANMADYCSRCGASIGSEAVTAKGCAFCLGHPVYWHRIVRVGAYESPLSDWILSLKFQRAWRWGQMLGDLLIPQLNIPELSDKQVAVCPVPMHWYRRWDRGFNQAHLIADHVGKHYHWPVMSLLKRIRYTPSQTRVVPSQRTVNVSQSVGAKNINLKDWTIVLVDDVKTSGATLSNCCRQLKTMGCQQIIAAVIAVADPRHDGFKSIDAPPENVR